jgi:hypothetical protein
MRLLKNVEGILKKFQIYAQATLRHTTFEKLQGYGKFGERSGWLRK